MTSLLEQGIITGTVRAEIIFPGAPTPTVPAAAAALGVDEESILKSLLFLTPDGDGILAIARGVSRIDRTRLAAAVGVSKVKLAPAEEVERRTGYPVGGAAPVCHATPLTVVMDRRLFDLDIVFGGGGTSDSMLRITPEEIRRLTGAVVAEIVESPWMG